MDDTLANSISRYFDRLPDPRREQTRRHRLSDIVTISICAVIAGADDFEAIAAYGRANESWFQSFLELPGGIPSHDSFWRVFRALDSKVFEHYFLEWTASLRKILAAEEIAIGGKQVYGSHDKRNGLRCIHLVIAWATQSGLLLGQVKVDANEKEIVSVPELLKLIDVTGAMVTLDALNCQVKTAKAIVDKGATTCWRSRRSSQSFTKRSHCSLRIW